MAIFSPGKIFVGAKVSSGKIFVGENFRHLTKISSLFPDEVFPDKVYFLVNIFTLISFKKLNVYTSVHECGRS